MGCSLQSRNWPRALPADRQIGGFRYARSACPRVIERLLAEGPNQTEAYADGIAGQWSLTGQMEVAALKGLRDSGERTLPGCLDVSEKCATSGSCTAAKCASLDHLVARTSSVVGTVTPYDLAAQQLLALLQGNWEVILP